MRLVLTAIMCIVLTGCASGYQQFYKPYVDARTLTDVHLLGAGEKPQIMSSTDLQRDVKIAASKGYRPIGASSFNGQMESEQAVIKQATAVGAVLVLVSSKFTESRTITTPLFLPNNQTTYSSGSVYGAYGSANYSGSSTTYGTTVVPITRQQQRYDQTAVYFVKSTKKPRFGLLVSDLPLELRSKYERNTGAIINVVIEESPAFLANVLPGDILVEFNDTLIINAKHATDLMQSAPSKGGKCVLKVIRNGTEKSIELHLIPG
ncbi:PDZ domain-containing protein [Paraherbaspirillum soli]|uniref:PDZ domain-containing protein n=1 Tax=Paraherbaspirillum soli TaxID=631222 RepID=A0ABW0M8W0_9BURK